MHRNNVQICVVILLQGFIYTSVCVFVKKKPIEIRFNFIYHVGMLLRFQLADNVLSVSIMHTHFNSVHVCLLVLNSLLWWLFTWLFGFAYLRYI